MERRSPDSRNSTWDYVVVGSGLAGLSFAALASHAGHRVLVLESHSHPGGYAHTFAFGEGDEQYRFNAQLHYVWNCGPGRSVHSFLRKLGLGDEVTFESFDPDGYDRMRIPGYALDIPYDYDELIARLGRLFPRHATQLAAFVAEVRELGELLDRLPDDHVAANVLLRARTFGRVVKHRNDTLQQAFDRFELPREAQALLALQWPDFLLPPDRLSYFIWVALFTGYQRGAYYPTRHFEHFVDSLVTTVENHGELRLQHRVVEFMLKDGAMTGVRAEEVDEDGVPTGAVHSFEAKEIVCNMDPRHAAERIGLEHFSRSVRKQLQYEYSPSNFVAYCVVEGIDLRDHGFGRSNLFHAEHADLNVAFDDMIDGDYSRPSFAMTVPTLLTDDRADCPEGKQIVELLTVADYDRFLATKLSQPRAYRQQKAAVFDAIADVIERDYVPGFRDHLCFKMLGSPTTNRRYVASEQGNSYGSNMTPQNIGLGRLSHDSSIPGLHFCNASSGWPGFAGTVGTGCRLYEHLTGDPVLTGPHVATP